MLSLVCCSQYETIPQSLALNVQHTIGVEYEWVWIYNKDNQYSIFEAYNIGVSKAKGDILVFMHQDIEYLTDEWGKAVNLLMSEDNVAACAVTGANYYRKSPSYYPCGRGHNKLNLVQKSGDSFVTWHDYDNVEQIVVFDGVWFCIRKKCFDLIRFDEHTYDGFHFYDIDIAAQLWANKLQVYTLPNVWIKHFSERNTDAVWLRDAFLFYDKWKHILPLQLCDIDDQEKLILEQKALWSSLRNCILYHDWSLLHKWFHIASEALTVNPICALSKVINAHFTK